MAIRFFPTTEDTDAQYEMLNRLLLELCELLRVMMVTRGAETTNNACIPSNVHLPDLLAVGSNIHHQLPRRRVMSSQTPPASPSCSYQHLSRTFSEVFDTDPAQSMAYFGDDEVFCSPNNGSSSLVSSLPVSRPTFPPRQRRRRRRTNSLRDSKRKSAKSRNEETDEAANLRKNETDNNDEESKVDAEAPSVPVVLEKDTEPETSMISTFLSTKLGGSIWTAVVIVLGWKLIANKR